MILDNDLDYATVHKTREKGHITKVERKVVFGTEESIKKRLEASPSRKINTAYIERSNGTLRLCDGHLTRKSPKFAKSLGWLKAKLAITLVSYNFITPHSTLSRNKDKTKTPTTPAMKAGVVDHQWTYYELLKAPNLCQ
jgi:hypothetical protein